MSADEYRDVKKRSSSTSTMVGIFAVIVFLIALLAIFIIPYLLRLFDQSDETIRVPGFEGLRYNDVVNDPVYTDDFSFEYELEPSNTVQEGFIIRQNPTEGREVKPQPGQKILIRLTVSSGEAPPEDMPELTGLPFERARNQLINMRLDLDIREESTFHETIPRNIVISTEPEAGVPISRGNTVTITYSMGPEDRMVNVPDMVGRTEAAVLAAFSAEDLVPVILRFEDPDFPAGVVTFIERRGESVKAGSSLQVHISTGPPPATPTPTPTPTPTETPTEAPPDP